MPCLCQSQTAIRNAYRGGFKSWTVGRVFADFLSSTLKSSGASNPPRNSADSSLYSRPIHLTGNANHPAALPNTGLKLGAMHWKVGN